MKVSIITATLNSELFIEQNILSILSQSYKDIEHIVIDGLSSDSTLDILNKYSDSLIFISESDNGIYDAFNKGLSIATGDIVAFLGSDDFFISSDAVSSIVKRFSHKSISAVFSDIDIIDRVDSKVVRSWKSSSFKKHSLILGWMPPHPTLFVRRDIYNKIGSFNTAFLISSDYLSIFKMFSLPGFKSVYIPNVYINMRIGGVSSSLPNIISKFREDILAIRSCDVSLSGSIFISSLKVLRKLPQLF